MKSSPPLAPKFLHDLKCASRVRGVFLRAALCAAVSVAPAIGVCQSISYGGVPLVGAKVSRAGAGLVKVEIAEEAFLVSEQEAGRRAALRLVRPLDVGTAPDFELFEGILREALRRKDADVARATLELGLTKLEYQKLDSAEVWEAVAREAQGRSALAEALKVVGQAGVPLRVCRALVLVQDAGDSKERAELQNLHISLSERCLDAATSEAARSMLRESDAHGARQRLIVAREIFSASSRPTRERASRVIEDLESVARGIESSDVDGFGVALDRLRREVENEPHPSAALEEAFTRVALEKGRVLRALAALSRVNFERRTPKLHSYALRALGEVGSSDLNALVDKDIAETVLRFAAKDEEISLATDRMIERLVGDLVASARLNDARLVLERYVGSDERRSSLSYSAIVTLVRGFLARGDRLSAEDVRSRWLPHPPVSLRLDLALARFGISTTLLASGLLIVGIGGVLFLRREEKSAQFSDERSEAKPAPETIPHEEPLASAVSVDDAHLHENSEYLELLQFFGLDRGASLSEIKHAYRLMVKEYHPDLNPNASEEDRERFISTTQRYDRLMQLIENANTFS